MKTRSLRHKLLAWNAIVVVGLLAFSVFAVTAVSQVRMRTSLDDDLERQGEEGRRIGPPPEQRGPGRGRTGDRMGPPDRPDGMEPGRQGEPPRGGPGGQGGPGDPAGMFGNLQGEGGPSSQENQFEGNSEVPPRFRPLYEASRRIADIRRPRFFRTDGVPRRGEPSAVDPGGLKMALRGQRVHRTVRFNGEDVRTYSAPLMRDGKIDGAVQVTRELRDLNDLAADQMWAMLMMLPIAAVAAGGAAVVLVNRSLKPIASLTRATSEIGAGKDLSRRLPVVGEDEFAELAGTVNGMLERLQGAFSELGTANDRLSRALESQRRFTADASHELRTPLTRMRLAAGVAHQPDAKAEELKDALAVSERASTSMTRLVEQLLTLARVDAGQLPARKERLDLRVVVAEALDGSTGSERIQATFPDHPIMWEGDADHLRRVITNLLENALCHTPTTKRIRLIVNVGRQKVHIAVADEGEGIAAEHLPKIFDRFYRVNSDRGRSDGGSGLGLAICRDLVHSMGGELTLESNLGKGTTAHVVLPAENF